MALGEGVEPEDVPPVLPVWVVVACVGPCGCDVGVSVRVVAVGVAVGTLFKRMAALPGTSVTWVTAV